MIVPGANGLTYTLQIPSDEDIGEVYDVTAISYAVPIKQSNWRVPLHTSPLPNLRLQ